MSFLKHYSLKYTPLSPIHIGADESYEPGNYVIDDDAGALYHFDSQAAMAALGDSDKRQLLAIVDGIPDDTLLTQVQAFFHHHRDQLIAFARPPIPTAGGIRALYQKRIGKTAQHESQGRRVINKLEIERTFYNPVDSLPILPGSSIKGAIRTALLDSLNHNQPLSERNERSQQLQERLLNGKLHTDPLRLLSLSDAHCEAVSGKPVCQVQFAVNRKRNLVFKNGQIVPSQAESKNLYQLLECVTPGRYQGFAGSLTLHDTRAISQDDRRQPKPPLQWAIKGISAACNAFYLDLFQKETAAMQERDYLQSGWLERIETLLNNGLLKRLHAGEAFLLRVGRHSGAEALTLNGARNIKILQGRGEKPKWEKQPKTWWLAADESHSKNALLPFGWVLVEIDPVTPNSDLQPWPEPGGDHLQAWMDQQLDKQNQLKQQTEARRRLEQEKILAEKQIAEAQKQQEAHLAALTPEKRQIEALKQKLKQAQTANAREQIGGPLYSALRELIGGAAEWPAEDKAELFGIGRDILKFIGAEGNKKAKELLKTLQ